MQATLLSPIASRFAWKEYRTLRGFWLAVLALGVVVQMLSRVLAAPGADLPAIMFGMALSASIMYAVGAAAILFSVEHEEETYQFLSGLPMRWLPMTVGKLGVATLSALALAIVLTLAGWAIGGGRWPSPVMASGLLALLGLAIFEALAWATLFSLLVKRPLAAVALALVVGTLATQLAVSAMSSQPLALGDLASYGQAIPLRLAIFVVLFAGVLVVARRWLAADAPALKWTSRAVTTDLEVAGELAASTAGRSAAVFASHRRLFARLLWQTWRQSWRSLLIPFGVTAFLWFVALLMVANSSPDRLERWWPLLAPLNFFLPALFGALVFSGDQRRRQYRFLAEHAARPRFVWFARHVVWLGTMVGISFGFALAVAVLTAVLVNSGMQAYVEQRQWTWSPPQALAYELRMGTMWVVAGTGLMGFGAMTAYAIGQLCSMLFRSEIIAVFVSLVLSAIVALWAAVLLLWNLTGWWFILPLALGCSLATWLRAPGWIIERNSWRAWSKPALAVAVPLVLIGLLVPPTRLGQVPDQSAAMKTQVDWYRAGDTPEARETAAIYERALALQDSWQENDPLRRWFDQRDRELSKLGMGGVWDIEAELPANLREGYEKAHSAQQTLINQAWDPAAKLATESSQRPTCRFDANWVATTIPAHNDPNWRNRESAWINANRTFEHLLVLASGLASSSARSDITVDRLLAALKLCDHLRQGQPTSVAARTLEVESQVLDSIARWAQQPESTPDQLRELGERLQELFAEDAYAPSESLVADHLLVRDVLTGKTLPLSFDQKPIPWSNYLAYLANELPWERARALRALDAVTLANISDVERMHKFMDGQGHYSRGAVMLQHWLRPNFSPRWPPAWTASQFHARSSYLMATEYELRVPIDEFYRQLAENQARRRALLLQIALLRYRHDHGRYPLTLAKLVPDYLKELPLDPYSGKPFNYSPFGLDLPLRRHACSGSDLIRQETPLIWSVGPGNSRLTQRETTSTEEGTDPNIEPTEVREEFYALVGVDIYWDNEPALVFPLPE